MLSLVIPSEARNPSSFRIPRKERFIAQKTCDGKPYLTPQTPFGMKNSEFFSKLLGSIHETAHGTMNEANTQSLREEFNRWAEAGRGDEMEEHHLPITLPVLAKMRLEPTDNVLDVGCGAGWLSRRIARMVPHGRVVGMDVSDEMIRVARRGSVEHEHVLYVSGEAGEIPWGPNFFAHAISVESAYYWPDPGKGLKEIFRVLGPGGRAWILIN